MELSQVFCIIYQTDCFENKKTVLYQGNALVKSGFLSYCDELGKQEFIYDKDTMHIKRSADAQTDVKLDKNKEDTATVVSEFGTLKFSTKVNYFDVQSDFWVVEYCIYLGDECSIHTKLECIIKKN